VIGGGDVAIDAARSALRLGSEVTIYYRRSREEMPAWADEVEEAEEEGVKIQFLASPARIIGENGRVVALECVRSELGAPDESGRRRPIPIPGSEFVEPVDTVIPAIGQYSDLALLEGSGIEVGRGWIKADKVGLTSMPGVFAGGDAVTGPAMVTDAIGAGAQAAEAIDKYLQGEPLTVEERPARIEFESWPRDRLPQQVERRVAATLDVETRGKSFDLVRLGLTRQQAVQEARRCINWNCCECALCAQICPMGTIEATDFTSHPSECTVCMDCVADCPPGVTTFKPGWISSPVHEYDPSRRQLLASGATAVVGFGLLKTGVGKSENPFLLRPPGASDEAEFLAKCVRCDQCIKVCPKQTLRPALFEAGWDGIWTPVLVPALGGCDFDCNACGEVCPSRAIPLLPLAEKRAQVIGVAVVNEETCIGCMICAEVCPVEGAIEEIEVERDGKQEPLPKVVSDLCIGCGVCEFECPVKDKETPIRVNTIRSV
jgi:ferredoxin